VTEFQPAFPQSSATLRKTTAFADFEPPRHCGLLGQLGIYFQLADFPQRLVWAGAADDERTLVANCGGRESKAP